MLRLDEFTQGDNVEREERGVGTKPSACETALQAAPSPVPSLSVLHLERLPSP